jgi:hypothetical protein
MAPDAVAAGPVAGSRRTVCLSNRNEMRLFINIPGIPEGLPAIFAGIPVNVTLLFSREQYVAAAEVWLQGIERRIASGLDPAVASVASVFVSRWDVPVTGKVPPARTNRLGIAIGQRTAWFAVLGKFTSAGIDIDALAIRLQDEGRKPLPGPGLI